METVSDGDSVQQVSHYEIINLRESLMVDDEIQEDVRKNSGVTNAADE